MDNAKKERWYNLYLDHEEEARYAEGVYEIMSGRTPVFRRGKKVN